MSAGQRGGLMAEEETTLLELSGELEEVTGRMRRAVIDMVHRARDRLHEAAARELEMRRAAQDLEQQQLIEQLDNMQALNVKHMQDMEAKEDFCDRLLNILFRLRGTNKDKSIQRKCLRAWRGLIGRGGWVESMGEHLKKQKEDTLLRRVLHAWRNDAGRSYRDRKLQNITALHEAELQRLHADTELVTSAQKVELLGCKDQIARSNEEKAILQERLKSHMMRGMCALNAEATMLLRGMATESGTEMQLPENIAPTGGNSLPTHFAKPHQQQQQQYGQQPSSVPAFPEYGGAAGQGSAATDSLLNMQGNLSAQLSQLSSSMPAGYIPGQHSVNFTGGGGAAMKAPPPAPAPAPVSAASGSRRDSGSLISFNNSHPAMHQLPVQQPGAPRRPQSASQRSTPSRR